MDVIKGTRTLHNLRTLAVLMAVIISSTSSEALFARPGNGNKFGIGKPASVLDLPPGQLRNSLQSLPPGQQQHALAWLQRLDFPEQDVESLRVNADGDLLYADFGLTVQADPLSTTANPVTAEVLADTELFTLHSKPGSTNVLYLDFDGEVISHTAWNRDRTYGAGVDPLIALPYDPSGNDVPATVANFTPEERKRIHEIWHRIAEDFAPFDIDVTTEEPVTFTATTGHVLFTHDSDANGNAMPSQGAGGVAWIGVFGTRRYVRNYSPALVYYTNLSATPGGAGDASLNAEAAAHEFGHNLNLSHDGTASTTYYPGHGSGWTRWGPIMGSSYRDSVSQWSQGEYPGANNPQDDLAVIAASLGYDFDEQGNTAGTAAALTLGANGRILVSDPELDPDNVLPENKGVIGDRNDVDWWYLDVGTGPLSLTVTPSWHAFNSADHISSVYRGTNLDISLALYDANLTLVDLNDPIDETNAHVSTAASAGRYYLRIDGAGSDVGAGYTDYASIGMYFIEGAYPPPETDTTAPSPNPMAWATVPQASGAGSMTMTAATASDPSGVEYDFICVAGAAGCIDSGWQTSSTYTPAGLAAGTFYSWKVRARDRFSNLTGDAPTLGDTTDCALVNGVNRGKRASCKPAK